MDWIPCLELSASTRPLRLSRSTAPPRFRLSGVNNNVSDVSAISTASSVADTEGIRMDLVNRIRAEIAAGTYETEAKLDIALNRMLNELQGL